MKNILLTTDFSENSVDAIQIGIDLARKFNSKIYLFHQFTLPIANADYPELIDFKYYEEIKQKQLDKLVSNLNLANLEIEKVMKVGFSLTDEVISFCKETKIDLIVMGLTGSSRISEIFMGSNSISLITHAPTPILAIPKDFKLNSNAKIAFAYDGKKIQNAKNTFDFLHKFSHAFDRKIAAFTVDTSKKDEIHYNKLKEFIPFEDFSFETELNDNVDAGILDYIANNKVEILALIPRKHSFFDRLFHESHTHEVAQSCQIPILVLPE